MNPLRTRGCRSLECQHTFHRHCLERWKTRGNYTCPICRAEFDAPRFRVRIEITPISEEQGERQVVHEISGASAENMARTIHLQGQMGADIHFHVDSFGEINEILHQEFNVLRPDLLERT